MKTNKIMSKIMQDKFDKNEWLKEEIQKAKKTANKMRATSYTPKLSKSGNYMEVRNYTNIGRGIGIAKEFRTPNFKSLGVV